MGWLSALQGSVSCWSRPAAGGRWVKPLRGPGPHSPASPFGQRFPVGTTARQLGPWSHKRQEELGWGQAGLRGLFQSRQRCYKNPRNDCFRLWAGGAGGLMVLPPAPQRPRP